jgi:hypothetical protein
MKELRFRKDGLWRFAFAFDSLQQAIVLVGGDKEGETRPGFITTLSRLPMHVSAIICGKSNPH